MIAGTANMAIASVRPRTVLETMVAACACGITSTTLVPSMPSVISRLASSARSARLAPACTTTTASTPRNRLTMDSRVRSLRARMPCRPMISDDRNRPDNRLTPAPAR
jgi:hypothetical protein